MKSFLISKFLTEGGICISVWIFFFLLIFEVQDALKLPDVIG